MNKIENSYSYLNFCEWPKIIHSNCKFKMYQCQSYKDLWRVLEKVKTDGDLNLAETA